MSTRRALTIALLGYSLLLAVALLAPTSGTQSSMASWVRDLGVWVGFSEATATQARAEFLCNALILAPVSLLGSLIWPRTTWQDWTAFGFLIASEVELTQSLLLPDRTASFADIVANTLGCLIGAAVVGLLGSRQARSPEPPQPPD